MASNEFIQSLINQLTEEGVKLAADDDKKHEKKKEHAEEKDKDERDNAFRERMRRAREKSHEKDDKQKSASDNFDLLTGLEALPEDLRKLASAEATSLFLADMARQSLFGHAAAPAQAPYGQEKFASDSFAEAELFNQVFEMHTAKLAALDPEYGMTLAREQEKMAFNQGFEDAVLAVQQGAGLNSAANVLGGYGLFE